MLQIFILFIYSFIHRYKGISVGVSAWTSIQFAFIMMFLFFYFFISLFSSHYVETAPRLSKVEPNSYLQTDLIKK